MFTIKYHNAKSQIVDKKVDAERIDYTASLVKFYYKDMLVDIFHVHDVVNVDEEKPKARYV